MAALLGAAVLFGAPARPVAAQVSDPPVVIDAYERARDAHNVDAALAQFADDATITVEGGMPQAFAGRDQIRRFLAVVVSHSAPRLTSSRHVVGNTVTWTERDQGQLLAMLDLSVEAVVRDGKIHSIVYRLGPPPPPPPSSAATSVVPTPLLGAAFVGAVSLLAIGLRMVLAGSRPTRPPSRLRGHLLAELDHWQGARRP